MQLSWMHAVAHCCVLCASKKASCTLVASSRGIEFDGRCQMPAIKPDDAHIDRAASDVNFLGERLQILDFVTAGRL